jgi:signal transduction histidine kinase
VRGIASRRWRPRRTLRLRLTVLYGGLFLIAGAALLAITYGLVANGTSVQGSVVVGRPSGVSRQQLPKLPTNITQIAVGPSTGPRSTAVATPTPGSPTAVFRLRAYAGKVTAVFKQLTAAQATQLRAAQANANVRLEQLRNDQLDTLLTRSGLALAIMALVSIGLGWLIAGRALRPVRTMSSRARGMSERNLHERFTLAGPDDELKELADTFDGLLGRLESAFESQRRFVANASHELRTPITLERALVEVALSDPNPTVESLREACRRVLVATEQQERLIEALLTLARSQRGLESRSEVDLRAVTSEVVGAVAPNGVNVESELGEARTTGDPAMVERLVANLVENAMHHNRPHGWVSAWTGVRDGRPTVEVANSGPVVHPGQVQELIKPFRRLDGELGATGAGNGLGLGLSIVQAIADAHGARLTTVARPEGGLDVAVSFPDAPAPD